MSERRFRISLFAMHPDVEEDSCHGEILSWLERWKSRIKIVDHSTGGFEDLWDIWAPIDAIKDCPAEGFCASSWSGFDTSYRHALSTLRAENPKDVNLVYELGAKAKIADDIAAALAGCKLD